MNDPPVNDRKQTTKKFPLIWLAIVFLLIGIGGLLLWFLLLNRYGREIDPPENLKVKLDSYLFEQTSLRTEEAKFYDCSIMFSTQTLYVAHVILSDPELNPNNGDPIDGKQLRYPKSQRIRAAFHPDRNWELTGLSTKPSVTGSPCEADE